MEHLEKAKEQFKSVIESLKAEFTNIRTNRPNPKMIEDIEVEYMERPTPIKHIGSIGVEPPRSLLVNVWDESAAKGVASGIEKASLGFGVSVQGKTIRVNLPELTQERKDELMKIVKKTAEEFKIRMRTQREDIRKAIKEIKDEDDRFKAEAKLQDIVDGFNKEVDQLVDSKEKEIME
ncbi:MAG: ribosome recycling factor [Candidatus Colwellbacteria bacterium CG10_big_fil_rev_8_21_14_0_10_41_28]|uniref:Ribosome recycling factor n=1 Tax=Candidatus Colwellbacteria bacterium CG10_big_fil_rev_8_21_14_0_10_41_28 TaxID=1974539 RepID=A0A2H0VJD1_9BACT|nr:MAG: ribosome recycling factor [Candidatus Colwellbacteria bacterium CG10_big_fil_rev_8_21_14_0_10_41_28]